MPVYRNEEQVRATRRLWADLVAAVEALAPRSPHDDVIAVTIDLVPSSRSGSPDSIIFFPSWEPDGSGFRSDAARRVWRRH